VLNIREGAILSLMDYKGFHRGPAEAIVDHLFKYLDSWGVGKKVARELPPIPKNNLGSYSCSEVDNKCELTQGTLIKAGYTAVEPLIKD